MNDLTLLWLFAQAFLLAVAAALVPGPDILLVLRSSVSLGRRPALLCTSGIGLGLLGYSTITFLFATAASHVPWLFVMIRVAGAMYLGYLGWCLLHSDPAKAAGQVQGALGDLPGSNGVGAWQSFQDGLISAATNPKLMLWFSAVVSQLVVGEGASQRAAILAGMVLGPVSCFSGLSFLGSSIRPWVNATMLKIIDRVAGGLLIALAVIGLALQSR